MFSTSARRAVTPIPSIHNVVPRAAATTNGFSFRCHQRRASSSKPSSPANGSKKLAEHEAVASTASKQASSKPTADRAGKKKAESFTAKSTFKGRDESMLHLPSVPSTQHIAPLQHCASAFFSLHRPISLTNAFPKVVTDEAFAAIFTPRTKANKSTEVINTLTSTVKKLDAVTGKLEAIKLGGQQEQWNENDEIRAGITAESYLNAEMETLDTAAEGSQNFLKQLSSPRYQPFNPPPPPVPQNTAESLAAGAEAAAAMEPQHRTYTAVLTIEESTDSNGEVTWTAHHSPIVAEDPPATPTRYLERLQIRRERANRESDMLAISVKRQRKLKMKKHKYKKLMRRTRNLRRRLDRA